MDGEAEDNFEEGIPNQHGDLGGQSQMHSDLYKAVVDDDRVKLEELINNGADVDAIFEDVTGISTKSILHVCCEKDRLECVRILLNHGAFVDIRDGYGQTPLFYCMIMQMHDIAELLLSKDQSIVDHHDRSGKAPLHCAVESDSVESVNLLLKYKADVCRHTTEGITPAMTAAMTMYGVENTHITLQLMIDAGYDLEMKDFRSKRTALQMAVIHKNVKAVEVLLAAGADVNTMDTAWRTPLTNAIYLFARKPPGHKTCVVYPEGKAMIDLLMHYNPELNMTLVEYCNPLIVSAFVDSAVLVQYFLERGSSIDIQFHSTDSTVLLITTARNNLDVFRVLLRWNCDLTPKGRIQKRRQHYYLDAFEVSVFLGHLDMTRILLNIGYNLQKIEYLKHPDSEEDVPECLKENPELLIWLQAIANNPRFLSQECVFCIRRALGRNVESKVDSLSLPLKIKDAIKLSKELNPSYGIQDDFASYECTKTDQQL